MVRDGQVRSGKLMGVNGRYFWIGIAEGGWNVVMVSYSGRTGVIGWAAATAAGSGAAGQRRPPQAAAGDKSRAERTHDHAAIQTDGLRRHDTGLSKNGVDGTGPARVRAPGC
jgi:hypothetical protein